MRGMDDDHLIAPRSLATRLADADEAYIRRGGRQRPRRGLGGLSLRRLRRVPALGHARDDRAQGPPRCRHRLDAGRSEPDWRDALRAAIDDLDALERPLAPLDEHRFGKRPTRHRLIDDPRERWPWLAA
jgi:hypothetical protein